MEPMLDLTLKLSLPVSDRTVETSLSLHTPASINSHQGIHVSSVRPDSDGGGGDRFRFLGGGRAISDHDDGVGNNMDVNVMFSNYILQRFSGAGNTSGHLPSPMNPDPAPVNLSECVMIDVPARRAQRNSSIANANAYANASLVGKRRGCGGGWYGFNERFKRCTNIKCNTDETPMWRKGPLGPKSLCNACGIKFRKEMERRARDNN